METKPSNNKTILIVVIAIVAVCCLCAAVAGISALTFNIFNAQTTTTLPELAATVEIFEEEPMAVATATNKPEAAPTKEPTTAPTTAPTQTPAPAATEPEQSSSTGTDGLGVSRQEMIDYFSGDGAMVFGEPFSMEGLEIIMGEHTWVCVASDCAAVTLGGPAEDLLVVAVSAPTDPDDAIQTTTAIALLMTATTPFTTEATSEIPMEMIGEVFAAQSAGESLDETIEANGYQFVVNYDPDTRIASLAIGRP